MDGDNLTFQLGDVTVGVFGLATPKLPQGPPR